MRAFIVRFSLTAILGGALSALSSAASAHPGPHAAEFTGGLAHPFTGLDHLLAALAVGLWASQLDRPARWLLPTMFPTVMIFGALLALGGPALSLIEPAIAASVLILGALIAGARQPAMLVSVPLTAAFALLHGYSHGLAAPEQGSILAFYVGLTAATAALHGLGLSAGLFAARTRWCFAAQSAGAAIALVGALLLFAA
ncbi:MAG TPA: HupE/UreJ family protein [Xanthobacteraceae bacterium]|nr:HupE/UreJ family protein [Xanthobacteraceae bacterium]